MFTKHSKLLWGYENNCEDIYGELLICLIGLLRVEFKANIKKYIKSTGSV